MTAATEAATTSSAPETHGGRSDGAAAARTEQLFRRHHRLVFGLCRALLRDHAEAEDAAQQTFLSAHRSLRNGSEPREPAAWLAAIARNECRARIATRMREPLADHDPATLADGSDPVAEALQRADLAALWRAVRALPRQQRRALLLREFGGLRYDELAAALGVSEPSVESLLFRARSRLRAALTALTGTPWLESLARTLAGSAAPAAAAKAVTFGLAGAALSTGALAGPVFPLDRQARPAPVVRHPAPHHADAHPAVALRPAARSPAPAPPPVAPVVVGSTAARTPPPAPAEQRQQPRLPRGGQRARQQEPPDGQAQQPEQEQADAASAVIAVDPRQPVTTATAAGTDGGDGGGSDGSSTDGGGSGD